jgi:hypothetical protein
MFNTIQGIEKLSGHFKSSSKPDKVSTLATQPGFQSVNSFESLDRAISNYNRAFISFKGHEKQLLSYDAVKELTVDPRKIKHNSDELRVQHGENYYKWYNEEFKPAYNAFLLEFIEKTDSVEELIKHRPDWQGAQLIDKFQQLHPGESLHFGQIPEPFGNKEAFDALMEHITSNIANQKQYSFSKEYDIPDFHYGDKTYKLSPLTGGCTGKIVFKVQINGDQPFVIKMQPDYPESERLNGAEAIGAGAVLDYYLTANNCENCAKAYYYDHKYNAALYEAVEKSDDQSAVRDMQARHQNFGQKMEDLTALGISFNDTIGIDNVLVRDGTMVMVDNGSCTFNHSYTLKPQVSGFTRELINLLNLGFFK